MESSKLYKVICEGKDDDVIQLLDDPGLDFKVRMVDGKSFLHIAVQKMKSVVVLKALLQKVDFTIRDDNGNTAIDLLLNKEDFPDDAEAVVCDFIKEKIMRSNMDELEELSHHTWVASWLPKSEDVGEDKNKLKQFIDDLQASVHTLEHLDKAVMESNWDTVKELLADNKLLKATDRIGLPTLHKAVIQQNVQIVEKLVNNFPEALSITDNMGRTPLHYAAGHADEHLYHILIDAGASENTEDINGITPHEIKEDPSLLPAEKTSEKLKKLLTRPQYIDKLKRKAADNLDEASQTNVNEEQKSQTSKPDSSLQIPLAAPTPEGNQPVKMYISPDVCSSTQPTTMDGRYVAENMGHALTLALADICEKRPWDPIEYLAQWLYKYQENVDYNNRQQALLTQIREEEQAKKLENDIKKKRQIELKQLQEEKRLKEQAAEEEKKRLEQEELHRQVKEAILAKQTGLQTVIEVKEEDDMPIEKPNKDKNGQTELHKLASQTGTDLATLLDMGYSIAERDKDNKTARDIAADSLCHENVEAIDKYVLKLIEMEKLDELQDLLLAGYDKLDIVVDQLKEQTITLTEHTQAFLNELPEFREKITAVFKAVQKDDLSDLNKILETKKLATAKDEYGRSPLHVAILAGHKEAVYHLTINFPVTMNCIDNMERTPLHYAMAISEEVATILEENGADTLAKDVRQRLPIYYKENPEEIQTLKDSLPSLFTETLEQANTITNQ